MRQALGVTLLLATGASAYASDATEARRHFDVAQTHFAVGEFLQAGDEYLEAYKLKPDAALLYNAAQSYRIGGNQEKALVLYKNYVRFYPSQPNISEVRVQITKLQDAIAAAEKAKTQPPTDTAEPKPQLPAAEHEPAAQPAAPPAATATNAPSTPAATATSAPAHTPIYKRWWLWTIVGVVVAGAVIAGAVVATTPSGSWANAPEVGPGRQALGVRF